MKPRGHQRRFAPPRASSGRIQEPQRRSSGNVIHAVWDDLDETVRAGTALRSVTAYGWRGCLIFGVFIHNEPVIRGEQHGPVVAIDRQQSIAIG